MLYQHITQKQQLKIHPQQLQMLHLFHLNTIELEQRIQNELEENPLIEQNAEPDLQTEKNDKDEPQEYQDWDEYAYDDTPDYHNNSNNNQQFSNQEILPSKTLVTISDFREEAINQLNLSTLGEEEKELGEFIINSLTEEGFLEGTADTVADDYSLKNLKLIDPAQVQRVINSIQSFEPVGIAAANIQECLLIQLKRMNTKEPDVKLAIRILENFYTELKARNFNRIVDALDIDEEDFNLVLDLLATLKLKPVPKGDSTPIQYDTIVPDFIVTQQDGTLNVTLFKEKASSLKINSSWKAKVHDIEKSNGDQATARYLTNKLSAAEWFVNAIKQRESTMLKVMKAIVKLQYDYFMTGDELLLRPMILKNVADMVGVDISTVSRITCNKYVQTPSGNILIKNLFNEGITNQEGVAVSVKKVQEAIQQVIMAEDKNSPYSDQQIATLLANRGLKIARRTVAKYRDELRIPAAQLRWNTIHHRTAAA
jgi:RNA polymerase sigma-54 factor